MLGTSHLRRPSARTARVSAVAIAAAVALVASVVATLVAGGRGPARAAAVRPTLASPTSPTLPTVPPTTSPVRAATTVAPVTTPPVTASPAAARLAGRLDAFLFNTDSCLSVTAGPATLYDHDARQALAPASTQKLLVAAAALQRLGPDFRFATTVVAARAPVGGRVGDLWLVGGGDPVLATPAYGAHLARSPRTRGIATTPIGLLVSALASAGVHTITGTIHGDDSRYDRQRYVATWPAADISDVDVGPIGALEVDEGLDQWTPKLVATIDPAAHAAAVLAQLLSTAGLGATGGTDSTAPPGAVVLARAVSPPLAEIVSGMLQASDNLTAELLVRELDRQAGGTGTTAGGAAVVTHDVAHLGLPTAGLVLHDGSGLDPADRASCATLLAALDLGDHAPFTSLRSGLAVAGVDGTMFNRFLGTTAQGRLAAKTGSIEGVNSLVGRLNDGADVRFAFVVNGVPSYPAGLALEDRIVSALETYPR